MFKLAPNLTLPASAPTDTHAFLGTRGAGKTYLAMKMAELLHDGGAQVVVVDPVGVWWGLRLAADGVGPGLSLPVFGGLHGDLPLEPTGGALCAQLVAEKRLSVVLDVSAFPSDAAWRRFVRDFARELFHLKQRNKSPMHVIFEEAHEFLPQVVDGAAAETVGAVKRLWKLGRNVGIGGSLVSQRAAEVNKGALNLTEMLFVGKLKGPQDRKAVAGWASENDGDTEAVARLPTLRNGQILAWLEGGVREIRCYPKRTFDSSKTPEKGDVAPAEALPGLDLEDVRAAMAATIEEAKANDPTALRAEVTRLRAEIAGAAAGDRSGSDEVERLRELLNASEGNGFALARELFAFKERDRDLTKVLAVMESAFEDFTGHAVSLDRPVDLPKLPGEVRGASGDVIGRVVPPHAPQTHIDWAITQVMESPAAQRAIASASAASGDGAARILRALESTHPRPLTRAQVGVLAVIKPSGGSFGTYISRLGVAGHITRDGGLLGITPAGRAAVTGKQPDARALVAEWGEKLGGKTREILVLMSDGQERTKSAIADEVGVEVNGGSFGTYLSRLKANGLIEKTQRGFTASSFVRLR